MPSLLRRCLAIVANVATEASWPLSADDQSELARVAARYVSAEATDSEIEQVVRNYYNDGPMYEMMRQHGNREGEGYWASYLQGFGRLAARRGVDFAECEDVASDAIGRALKSFAQFSFRGPLNAWLYRIAVNACNDWHKQRLLRARIDSPLPTPEDSEEDLIQSLPAPAFEQPAESLLSDERRLILQVTLDKLLSHRDLVILHYSFVETNYLDPQTGQPRPWTDNEIARLVDLAPASIPTIRARIMGRLAADPDLKEVMIQVYGPKWFAGRARPVRKTRRRASDPNGQSNS